MWVRRGMSGAQGSIPGGQTEHLDNACKRAPGTPVNPCRYGLFCRKIGGDIGIPKRRRERVRGVDDPNIERVEQAHQRT